MKKMLTLAVGVMALAACEVSVEREYTYEEYFEETYGYNEVTPFARGTHFQDQATVWGTVDGVALADDDRGAVGMVGMVCSLNAQSGNIQVDVDESPGDEVVVDALVREDGTFEVAAIDRDELVIARFGDWVGAVETQVTVPGGDIAFMALTQDDRVLLQNTDAGDCRVTRAGADGVADTELPGLCTGLDANAVTGIAYVATMSDTFVVEPDLTTARFGPAGDVLAYSSVTGDVAIGDAASGHLGVHGVTGEVRWTVDHDGLVGVSFVAGGQVAVATTAGLFLYDLQGELLEHTETTAVPQSITASPDGNVLAVPADDGTVHLVRLN